MPLRPPRHTTSWMRGFPFLSPSVEIGSTRQLKPGWTPHCAATPRCSLRGNPSGQSGGSGSSGNGSVCLWSTSLESPYDYWERYAQRKRNLRAYWIDRRLNGLAGPEYHAIISFGLPIEPEDSQYGKSWSNPFPRPRGKIEMGGSPCPARFDNHRTDVYHVRQAGYTLDASEESDPWRRKHGP